MASSLGKESRCTRGVSDRFIYSLGVDLKHYAPVTIILVNHRHITKAPKLVSCVPVLHVGTPLGNSASALDCISHPASIYRFEADADDIAIPHFLILHSSIITVWVHHRHFGRVELDICFKPIWFIASSSLKNRLVPRFVMFPTNDK